MARTGARQGEKSMAGRPILAATGLLVLAGCSAVPLAPVTDTAHYGPPAINQWTGSAPTLREAYGEASPRQFGELRVPPGKGPFPIAMLVHGGCWLNMGSTANMVPMADWLLAHGVASWNVDYREVESGGGWPNSFLDWAGALAHLKGLAERYPLDLGRVSVIGHSAGTLPASWLASGSQGDGVVARDLPAIRAAMILDGPIELAPFRDVDDAICGEAVIDDLMGGTPEQVPARYAMVDPDTNPPVVADMVLVDAALPSHRQQTIDFIRSRGTRVEVVTVSQDQHFDLLKPGTADFSAIAPALLRVTGGR